MAFPATFKVAARAVLRLVVIVILVVLLLKVFQPLMFQYFISYSFLILKMAYEDADRHESAKIMSWQMEWKLHEMEMVFNQDWCKKHPQLPEKVSWLTAMMNDNYAVGAVFVAYMLKKLSCHHNMIALVADTVTPASRDALKKAGYDVRVVEALDCNWMDKKNGQPEKNSGLPGTHMRFHAWNYTEFSKILYVDPDVMPLANIDEIFSMNAHIAASYCGRPGHVDPCFNAGLLLFRPSAKVHGEILQLWSDLSKVQACPNDQVLLWHYYADNDLWTPLPYAYNVRREIYHPMKVYHFACCLTPKPWNVETVPTREQAAAFSGPIVDAWDMVFVWWRYFYEALDEFELHKWYNTIKYQI